MFKINNKEIGASSKRPFIIAEVGQNHEGSFDLAIEFIEAVSQTGADAVKFQTHIASAESTLDEEFRIKMNGQDKTRFDYWKRMEFTEKQWIELKSYADNAGLIFLSSPFSIKAIELLERLDVPAWKVGSGEAYSSDLINAMCKTGKPILLSTGMSNNEDIKYNVDKFRLEKSDFALFQCVSRYPSSYNDVGLNVLDEFRNTYNCPVGLSDHSGTIYPSIAAIIKGADLIEFHITLDRQMSGPDTSSSVTGEEAKLIVEAAKAISIMKANPVNKNILSEEIMDMKMLFTKSLALISDQKKGTILNESMLTTKKPGNGIPYKKIDKVIGSILIKDVSSKRLLQYSDMINSEKKDS